MRSKTLLHRAEEYYKLKKENSILRSKLKTSNSKMDILIFIKTNYHEYDH